METCVCDRIHFQNAVTDFRDTRVVRSRSGNKQQSMVSMFGLDWTGTCTLASDVLDFGLHRKRIGINYFKKNT
ncbi:hypothetical protein CEXT_811141 [Caerostris extrusa]|uniref:Uncharacterized protein n=1 Tax=Caerostris extrusa TaxID=172846 RepID=A0AAV4VYY5_CAEEX|nr:hypothetical protein CEXT_811141 [Caerostris extrusa]